MTLPKFRRRTLAAVVLALTTASVVAPAFAQNDDMDDKAVESGGRADAARKAREARHKKSAVVAEQTTAAAPVSTRFPNATRSVPVGKASVKGTPKLQALLKTYNAGQSAEARVAADAIIGDAASNPYEKAFAAQLAAQTAISAQDYPAALRYIDLAIAQNSLDNDAHFGLMQQRAQIQMMSKDYGGALASVDRFLAESRATDSASLVLRGNALYRLGRYAEAAAVLKPAVAAAPGHSDWDALLADSLSRSGNTAEAAKIAEGVAAKNPGDKQARFNLVQSYLQTKQTEKAAQLLEEMRKSGQLTDDSDYRQLFSIYANIQGKEQQTIDTINEGMSKGVLKPDYNVYLALAQSYYFSDQTDKAIAAYQKAAALGKDGEAALALAGVLRNEQRIPEAKAAAQQALAKGLKHPEDAKKIIALPGK
ncbi:tetratricopeptide repeat protein [Cognatilysobacter lacus]|uniref:Tetratricopeptide repeat protein n=1 Tax=Cognatilysobacter lacus TaxID=1643323 RepID=A0A5D8Z7X0_9GAMM|nr:tetratricopeptide repeat protein [Lysobacter lacus]TZF90891.1 tetratricopeptide repeat protein [Lysobacter lacus]